MAPPLPNRYIRAPQVTLLYIGFILLSWWPLEVALAHSDTHTTSANTVLDFDIQAQSLEAALQQYSLTTGLNILVDSRLITSQYSPGAQGSFTVKQALQQLIAHSGLEVQYTSSHMFTLMPNAQQHKPTKPFAAAALRNSELVAVFQRSLEQIVCQSSLLPSGNYRMLIQIWLSPHGGVETVRLVRQTNNMARDEQILEKLRKLAFPSPSGRLPQPITLLLQPDKISSGCPN